MRFFSSTLWLLAAGQLVHATESCSTDYGSKSIKSVHTKTTTTKITTTSTFTDVKNTTTRLPTTTSVFTITNSSSTYTKPTPSGFTPLASAGTVQPTPTTTYDGDDDRRRKFKRTGFARSGAASSAGSSSGSSSSYPKDVQCTTTLTKQRKTTVRSTRTSTLYKHTVTTTTEVAGATILAACQEDNMLLSFNNTGIGFANAYKGTIFCGYAYGPSFSSGDVGFSSHACRSAYDCCATVVSGPSGGFWSGWSWSGGYCEAYLGNPSGYGDYVFGPGGNDGAHYWGNGAYGGGVWTGNS